MICNIWIKYADVLLEPNIFKNIGDSDMAFKQNIGDAAVIFE